MLSNYHSEEVFLNGKPLKYHTALFDYDVLQIGDCRLFFRSTLKGSSPDSRSPAKGKCASFTLPWKKASEAAALTVPAANPAVRRKGA